MLNALTTPRARSTRSLTPVLAAHLAQEPGGHAREGEPEVGLRADLLHVGGRPAGLAREHVELHQQHGLADAAQARVDEAALVAAGAQALDQRLHVLEVGVAAGEDGRLAARSWRVRVLALVHSAIGFLTIRLEKLRREFGQRARAAGAALAGLALGQVRRRASPSGACAGAAWLRLGLLGRRLLGRAVAPRRGRRCPCRRG